MLENCYITPAQAQAAKAEPLVAQRPKPAATTTIGPYFVEEVRRELMERYGGEEAIYAKGLLVRTTLDSKLQDYAERAFIPAIIRMDRQRGWRGPVGKIEMGAGWERRLRVFDAPVGPPWLGWQGAVVTGTTPDRVNIGLADGRTGSIPLWGMNWSPQRLSRTSQLAAGDVIVVKPQEGQPGIYTLQQPPLVSGGFVAMDPHSGRVLAMVGGFDMRKSSFNRATQALRQPGSAFKPFVYAAALDNGYSPVSIVVDRDFCVNQGRTLGKKCFRNFSGRSYGPQTMRIGLEYSRNLMTVRLAYAVGMEKVVDTAERLGIVDQKKMLPVLANALGASETTVLRLVNAYAILVNAGQAVTPTLIERVQDRHGKTLFRRDTRVCRECLAADWQGQAMPSIPVTQKEAIDRRTAYQIVHMLEGVINRGTGQVVKSVNRPLAGKTGTTNDARDVWFVGMSPDLVAGLYIGFDQPRSMGGEQGGTRAAPVFRDFIAKATDGLPPVPFRIPDGVRLVRVDSKTGQLALSEPDGERVIYEAFKPGTEPLRASQKVNPLQSPGTLIGADAAFAADTGGIY
jgi:penicillin-binding protein 1A